MTTATRLDQAHIRAAQTLSQLQNAAGDASPLEYLTLLPLMQRATELERDILALASAIRESEQKAAA